ncbi:MAG: 3-isopropylmalate dehydrogenase [bacterium]
MKEYKIAVLKGDGIGPEIITQGINVLNAVAQKFGHTFTFTEGLIGGIAYEKTGHPLPEETVELCKNADAVYLGAVGDYKYDTIEPHLRPEQALLGIRKKLNLFANLRPVEVFEELAESSTLKKEYISGIDIMILRELTGGAYFGEPRGIEVRDGQKVGFNTMVYSEFEIERAAISAFEIARKRNKKLCSVDKANVLEVSRLWREVVNRVGENYKDVELSHMYVDNAAMQLIRNPKQFDVILTENLFGDILSDAASMLAGSLGMLASASMSDTKAAIYEPIHGSAPDIAGKGIANPIATILSASMMLKYSFNLETESETIIKAVKKALKEGYRTADIMQDGCTLLTTEKMGEVIASNITVV